LSVLGFKGSRYGAYGQQKPFRCRVCRFFVLNTLPVRIPPEFVLTITEPNLMRHECLSEIYSRTDEPSYRLTPPMGPVAIVHDLRQCSLVVLGPRTLPWTIRIESDLTARSSLLYLITPPAYRELRPEQLYKYEIFSSTFFYRLICSPELSTCSSSLLFTNRNGRFHHHLHPRQRPRR